LSPAEGQVSHVLLTRAPLSAYPKTGFPFDLHVLGTPPAFILSQDQTLHHFFFQKPAGPWSFLSLVLRTWFRFLSLCCC
jgi:hypothetical protein